MLSDNFSIDVNSISSECNVWEKNCAARILHLPVELLFPEIKYGLLTSADSTSIGNSISAACNALEKNCEAQNFDITGASIDETNPTHHMVLRRSRRKVKLQSQTGSIQETVEH